MARQYGNLNIASEIIICVLIAVSIWIASALFLVANTTWQKSLLEQTGTSQEGIAFNNVFIQYVLADDNKLFSSESLNDAESSHMTNVRSVFRLAFGVLLSCIAISAVLISRVSSAKPAIIAGAILSMVGIITVVFLPFMSFFTSLHKVFFPEGNWIFPAASFLIQTYNVSFWEKIVQVWGELVICVSIFLIVVVYAVKEVRAYCKKYYSQTTSKRIN